MHSSLILLTTSFCAVIINHSNALYNDIHFKGNHYIISTISNNRIIEIIRENFELQPTGIIEMLNLRQPIYKKTAAYGHFGRGNCGFPWEKTDKAEIIKKYL